MPRTGFCSHGFQEVYSLQWFDKTRCVYFFAESFVLRFIFSNCDNVSLFLAVFRIYDPEFIATSLDEAYLNVSNVCEERGLTGEEVSFKTDMSFLQFVTEVLIDYL